MFEAKWLQALFYGGMVILQPRRVGPLVLLCALLGTTANVQAEKGVSVAIVVDGPAIEAEPEPPLPCVTNSRVVQASLQKVFKRLRSSQVTSLPGPAGSAIRAQNAAEVARSHLDVEHFAKEVFRSLWPQLDVERQEAWKSTLQSLLQHRYIERIRDPRRHHLKILSTEVDCHIAKSRVSLHTVGSKAKNTLEFHMRLSRAGWRVYDVVLEGASLVNAWRSRLSRVHREEGHAGLDKQLHRLMRRYDVAP